MKKLVLMLLFAFPSLSCDLCGCANSNSFLGLMPASNRGFLGIRYRQQSFESHLNSPVLKTRESFQTTEIWGRFYPFNRVQIMGVLPYSVHTQDQIAQGNTIQLSGLSDPTFFAHYNLVNTLLDSSMHVINQSLLVGVGVKPPLGKFHYEQGNLNQVANANFQLGTGSTDFMGSALYNLRYNEWGINIDAQYRLPGENSDAYRFGPRSSVATTVFFVYGRGHQITLMPYASSTFEYAAKDLRSGDVQASTGGSIHWLGLGLEAFSKRFVMGVHVAQPFFQNLSGGELKAIHKLSFHLSYFM